jgi:hypothetical protein
MPFGKPSFEPTEKFVMRWVRGVLDEAGVSREHPGAAQLAQEVAEGVILASWRSTAETWNAGALTTFLESQRGPGLVGKLWNINVKIRDIAFETASGSNPQKRAVMDSYNRNAATALKDIRANYVSWARQNLR